MKNTKVLMLVMLLSLLLTGLSNSYANTDYIAQVDDSMESDSDEGIILEDDEAPSTTTSDESSSSEEADLDD